MRVGRDWTGAELAALRRVLSGLFPRELDQRRFVADFGLPAGTIAFDPSAENTWFSILQRAKQTKGIEALIEHALTTEEGKESGDLRRFAEGGSLAPLGAPDIKALGWHGAANQGRQLERVLGETSTLVPVSFLALGLERARSVALVRRPDAVSGSGFLVADDLFVTNHHVIADPEQARAVRLVFDYERTITGLAREAKEVALAPNRFFTTSPAEDWTIVATEPGTVARWGALALSPAQGLGVGSRVNIIQHPGGGEKKLSYLANAVVYVGSDRVQYLTDTEPGSSGSPVFDMRWRLVALHHSGGYLPEPGSTSSRTFLRNEGILIDAVVRGLAAARGG